jgi:hypothetical protein
MAQQNTSRKWEAGVTQVREAYAAEVQRLAAEFEPRIRAGAFSGCDDDGPRYSRLEQELASHPWCAAEDLGHLVLACSSWPSRARRAAVDPESGEEVGLGELLAGDCLAHDVLQEAVRCGWLGPLRFLNDADLYPLRASALRRVLASPRRAPRRRSAA